MSYEWRKTKFMSSNKSTSEIDSNDFNAPVSMQTNVVEDNGQVKSQQNNNRTDKENNNQIIQGDKNIIIQVNNNHSTAEASEKIANPKEEKNIAFIITGSLNITQKHTLKAIEKHLQKIAADTELTIVDIDEGSLKFVLKGSPEGLKRIEESFNSGELTEIFDVPIESVEFIEPEKEKLAFTITGDISYTDVAKLKAAVTGVDEKELLIRKIRTDGGEKKLNLSGADLGRADLSRAYLSEADLSRAYLSEADLSRADLSRANLSEADLIGADLIGADLSRANLSGANLSEAYLIGAYLSGANLSGANLSGANLSEAYLIGAKLSRADLIRADLREADLSGADLVEANLIRANLREAGLGGAHLIRAKLEEANLIGAHLIRAKLREANLREAYLIGANLREANLSITNLREADLSRANLSGANLRRVKLTDSKVTNTKFSSNSPGMTEELKQNLIKRRAIFEDSLEDPLIRTYA